MYTMNGSQLLWKGKPARLAKGATGRRITDTMATDGHTLYFAQKRVKLPAGINLDRLRIRVFNENPVNLLGAVLDDGESVWQLGLLAEYVWPLPGAAFEAVQRFPETAGVYRDDHLRDSSHVWYRGELIDGLAADKAQVVDDSIVSDGEHVWIFGKRSEEFRRKDITPIGEGLTRTDDALLLENAENRSFSVVANAERPPPCDQAARAALRALAHDLFGVFATYPQIIVPIQDMDWDKIRSKPRIEFESRFDGASLVLQADGIDPVRCEPDGWYRGLCTLWIRHRALRQLGFAGTLVTYPCLGIGSPYGNEFRSKLIKANRDVYLQFCGAVFSQQAHLAARMMLHGYVEAHRFGKDGKPFADRQLVANLPRGLFEGIFYSPRRYDAHRSTYLAAGRHIVKSGMLADPDPRVRLEMLEMIHAVVLETDRIAQFYRHVLPSILQRQECETVALVSEQADSAVEAFIIRGLVKAEVHHERMADRLEPIIRRQIERGINVPLNRSRLIEVLIHQGLEAEAEAAITAFKADFGAGFMLPGLSHRRHLYLTVDDAVAAMRQRASELK